MAGTEIANAYIALTVKMPNAASDIRKGLGAVDADAEGARIGSGLTAGISSKSAALAGAVGGLVASLANRAMDAFGAVVGEAVEASDATDKFRKSLDFAGLDTSAVDDAISKSRKYADQTVYDLTDIQRMTAQLASNGVENYSELTEAAGNLNAIGGGNAETFSSLAMMMTQTAGAGKLTTENWNQLNDAVTGAAGPLQDALLNAGAYTGNFREAMERGEITAEEFNAAVMQLGTDPIAVEAAKSTDTFEGSLGNLTAMLTGKLADALTAIKPLITGFVNAIADFASNSQVLMPVLAGLAGTLVAALAPAIWGAVTATWAWTAALLANPVTWIVLGIGALIAALVALFMNWDAVVGWISGVWSGFISWITGVIDGFVGWWNGIWSAVGAFISAVWSNIVASVSAAMNFVAAFVAGAVNGIRATWESVWNGIGSFLKGVWNNILGWIEGGVNGAIDLINGMMGGIKDVAGFVGIQVGTIPHVDIPRLADGGVVSKRPGGILANIGEGRYDEAVVPLSPQVLAQLGGGGRGGGEVNIYPMFRQDDARLQMRQWAREAQQAFAAG